MAVGAGGGAGFWALLKPGSDEPGGEGAGACRSSWRVLDGV